MRDKTRSATRARLFGAGVALAFFLTVALPATGAGGDTAWTLAGTGGAADSGDGGQAREAEINQPRSVFATAAGGYVWAEPWSNRVRIVGPDGVIATLAGNGGSGFGGDGGQAAAATLRFVHSAAPTADGGYLLADTLNNRIRKVSSSGVISTVAGTGAAGFAGDGGPATSAQINNPRGVVALPDGGFLIPDSNNHRVRKVSSTGVITTVAGTGVQGFTGDGGAATAARLSIPFGVAPTADGGFLIVDVGNQRIRKVSSGGVISTVAGNGVAGYSGDGGAATAAQLRDPHNAVALSDGSFLIADASNQRVRRVGADGVITTLMGNGVNGYSGDGGPAAAAQLSVPKAVALSAAGDVLIADEQNNRIRFVGTLVAPANTQLPTIAGIASEGQQLTAAAGGWSGTGPVIGYRWQRCSPTCVDIGGATSQAYTVVAADTGSTLRVNVTGSNPAGSATASSAQTAVVGGGTPPSNTGLPVVSGTAQEGQTLNASSGSWSGSAPITFAYQWQRCSPGCTAIAGASASTYLVAAADVGSTLRVVVTGSNTVGSSSANSAQTATVTAAGETTVTFTISSNADDGDVSVGASQAGGYPPAGTPAADASGPFFTAGRRLAFGDYEVMNALLRFDTSPLPDNATITSARLRLHLTAKADGDNRNLTGEWYPGLNWPLDASDWTLNPGSDALPGSDLTSLPTNTTSELTLSSPTSISRTSYSGLRLGISGTQPTADNYLQIAALEHPSAPPPQLIVTYTSGGGGPSPPVNTSPPVVSGSAQVGQTLSASTGSWSGTAPITFAYQWQRCSPGCTAIAGASASTYLVAAADVGSTLRVVVTGSNTVGSSSANSAQTATVTAAGETTVTFTISSNADDGDVSVGASQAGGYPPAGTPAADASGPFFTAGRRLAFGDYEVMNALLRFDTSPLPDNATITSARLRLHLTAKADGDNRNLTGEWYPGLNWPLDASDWTLNPGSDALPGSDLTSLPTNTTSELTLSSPTSISRTSYSGLRLGISGTQPTADNYLQIAALEHPSAPPPQLIVTYTSGGGGPSPPVNTSPPVVSGSAQVGQTLSASTGSWSGTAPITFAYQWQRCSPGCTAIAGASASTYLVAAADVGSTLRVVVTGSNTVGSSSANSAQTATVTAAGETTVTFTISSNADDGDVSVGASQAGGYPPAGTPAADASGPFFTAGRRLAFGDYEVMNALLRFDTSPLPDNATITSARLRLHLTAKADGDNRNLTGEWYPGLNWPLDASDWTLNPGSDALPGSDLTSLPTNTTSELTLSSPTSISRTSYSGLRLGISGTQPTADNYLQIAALEHPSAPPPQLIVTYTTP